MKPESHLDAYNEHREAIFTWALQVKGIEKSQRIIGLHACRGAIDLLSACLHEKGLLSTGAQLNHRWFKSKSVAERLPPFPQKETIVHKLVELETVSEDLSYGAPKSVQEMKRTVSLFLEIEKLINDVRGSP